MPGLRPNEIAAAEREHARRQAGDPNDPERACLHCGYSLRGLAIGAACPECGMSSKVPEAIDDPLSRMPVPVILRFKWGCWATVWTGVLGVLLWLTLRSGNVPELVPLVGLAALAVHWQVVVRLVTPAFALPQASMRGFSPRGRLRIVVQWLQLGWLLAIGATLADVAITSTSPQFDILPRLVPLGLFVGVVGIFLWAILLGRLAEWTCDKAAETVFNWAVWTLPFTALLLMWTPRNFVLGLAFLVLAVVPFFMMPIGLISLAKSISYSVYHSIEHEDRQERQDTKRAKFFRGVVEPYIEAHATDPEPPPITPTGEVPLSDD